MNRIRKTYKAGKLYRALKPVVFSGWWDADSDYGDANSFHLCLSCIQYPPEFDVSGIQGIVTMWSLSKRLKYSFLISENAEPNLEEIDLNEDSAIIHFPTEKQQ